MKYLKKTKCTQKLNIQFPKQKIGYRGHTWLHFQLTTHPCLKHHLKIDVKNEMIEKDKRHSKAKHTISKTEDWLQRTDLVALQLTTHPYLKLHLKIEVKDEILKKDKMHSKVKHTISKTEDWLQRTDFVTLQLTTHPYFCLTFVINLFKSCMDSHFPSYHEKTEDGIRALPAAI